LHDMKVRFGLEVQIHSFLNFTLYRHLQCNNIKPVTYAQIELCLPFYTLWVKNGIIMIIIIIIATFTECKSTPVAVKTDRAIGS